MASWTPEYDEEGSESVSMSLDELSEDGAVLWKDVEQRELSQIGKVPCVRDGTQEPKCEP